MQKKNHFSKGLAKFIKAHRAAHESLPVFLGRLLRTKSLCMPFFDYILTHPRESKQNHLALASSFKTKKASLAWFLNHGGYGHAFGEYILNKWNQAKNVEEVLKWMPNFCPWMLESRFNGIRVGAVPDDFVNENTFLLLLQDILRSKAVKNYLEIKRLEGRLDEFAEKYPQIKKVNMFQMDERREFIKDLLRKQCTKPFKLKKDGKSYTVEFLCNPFSNKIVFKIATPSGKSYIVKTLPYNFVNIQSDRARKEHENQAIRADSPFSNAMLEFYLKFNHSEHAPKILYYNYQYEVALYEKEEGDLYTFEDKPYAMRDFYCFNKKIVKDANLLGVYINDISLGNFLISKEDKKIKIIDIGHASYVNPLVPPTAGLCFTFGNLCGREYLPHFGIFSL